MSVAAAQMCLLLCSCIRNLLARMLEACEGNDHVEIAIRRLSAELAALEKYLKPKARL